LLYTKNKGDLKDRGFQTVVHWNAARSERCPRFGAVSVDRSSAKTQKVLVMHEQVGSSIGVSLFKNILVLLWLVALHQWPS